MVAPHYTPSDHDLELLSALLDGELSDRERISLEQRLTHDTELRAVLDDLRDTVAMVRDLPPLKAPRNFTLDPAIYSRPVPWWQQIFTLGNVLQLSGAVGTIAAILIIASAFMLGNEDSARDESGAQEAAYGEPAGPGAAMMAPTQTLALLDADAEMLAPTATRFAMNQATAIANSNTDALAFDATLEAQSSMYASTEIFGTMTALSPETMAMESVEAQADAAGGQAFGESNTEDDVAMDSPPPQPLVMGSPTPESAVLMQQSQPATGGDDANAASALREGESTPMLKATAATATRTATATATATTTPQPTQTQASTAMPTADTTTGDVGDNETDSDLAAAPEDAEDGQFGQIGSSASSDEEAEQPVEIEPAMEYRAADQDDSDNRAWVFGLGALILVVSLAVLTLGWRRSRRA